MQVLLRGGRVVDPAADLDAAADVLISDGKIAAVGAGLRGPDGGRVIELRGLLVVPGLVDLHTHLREPGQEYKEDIASGSRAAAAGGYTSVCPMPNTVPVNDNRAVTELMLRRAREVDGVRLFPVGAISRGLAGDSLSEMGELKDAGIVAVSDDGKPVMNAELMRRALEYARTFGLPVVQHAEDTSLSAGGAMAEGAVATRVGLPGQPAEAESVMVARDLLLVERTGARYHVAHVSTAQTVRLVREAKKRGLPVTCEVTPHHLTLTDEACSGYDTSTKCAPPLRSDADRAALREALTDGTIDAIATDHAPHSLVEKDLEFDQAAFGMIGLETALPLALAMQNEAGLTLKQVIALLTCRAARVFGLPVGTLAVNAHADLAVIDPTREWKLDPTGLQSKSRNTPFGGWSLRGRAVLTVCGGRPLHDAEKILA
jgi:dihydroorotase